MKGHIRRKISSYFEVDANKFLFIFNSVSVHFNRRLHRNDTNAAVLGYLEVD